MIISKRNKALVMRLRDPSRVTTVIPKAKVFQYQGKEFVVVKHGPEETKVLRNIGIDAPSPINFHYDWPGRFSPFEAQRDAAAFISLENRAFNLSDLGTGKTMATLWAYDYLRSQGVVKKALVITPLSTLERTWADEVFNHFPHLEAVVLHGSRERRLSLLDSDADLYLINHDGIKVSGFVEALAQRHDIDLIIIDEIAQVGRTAGTDRYKSLQTICNRQTPRKVWGLTGTPTPNAPTDAWAQCKLIVPEKVPPYFNKFKDMVMRQINQFLWVPRPNAIEVVHEAMQPSIRFSRDECVDLPPCMYETRTAPLTKEQQAAYKDMLLKLRIQAQNGEITAANEAVKAQKLIQVACLAYNTPVLTDEGWIAISAVTRKHLVWDGVEWVSQCGAAYMGDKEVTQCLGVTMTEDHKVLTTVGWVSAKEINDGEPCGTFNRAAVRLPYRGVEGRNNLWQRAVCAMVVPLRLRARRYKEKSVPSGQTPHAPAQLRVPPRQRNAPHDQHAGVQYMVEDETTVFIALRQRLEKLRRAWDNSMRPLGQFVRELLGGHGWLVPEGVNARPDKCRRTLLQGKLSLGHCAGAKQQQAPQRTDRHAEGGDDGGRSRKDVRVKADNDTQTHGTGKQEFDTPRTAPVYDLINCGPRNRFVVNGVNGPLIVHNCGVVYDGDGGELVLDAGPRVDAMLEIIEQAGAKVIVFVPFRAVIDKVLDAVRKAGHTAECIHGGVSKGERDRIFSAFMKTKNPHVLVAQPASMSHGLTLTEANTIIWYAPITSNETFLQANARITRPGQRYSQLIVMLEGTPVEERYYRRLKEKERTQGLLLSMIEESRDDVLVRA